MINQYIKSVDQLINLINQSVFAQCRSWLCCPGWVDDGQEGKQRDQDLGSSFNSVTFWLQVTESNMALPLSSLWLRFLSSNRCRWVNWSLISSFPNQVVYGFITATSARESWVTGAISQGLFCQTAGQFEHQVLGWGSAFGLPAVFLSGSHECTSPLMRAK